MASDLAPSNTTHHPRASSATRLIIERALEWALATGRSVPGVLEIPDLERLLSSLRGTTRFAFQDYGKLAFFSQIVWRSAAQLPIQAFSLGDALHVVADLLASEREQPELVGRTAAWSFSGVPSNPVLRELGYIDDVRGLERQQALHRPGWLAHGVECKAFTLTALEPCPRFERAVIFGAARVFDVPLAELARRFQQVVLVDIDQEALAETLSEFKGPGADTLQALPLDVTGITGQFHERVQQIFAEQDSAPNICERVSALLVSYALPFGVGLAQAIGRADLVVSQMILSQLNALLERYPRKLYKLRFSDDALARSPAWREATKLFAHLLQQDHLDALSEIADTVVLTSDVAEQSTRKASENELTVTSDERLLLGAYRLQERLPREVECTLERQWYWQRALPTQLQPEGARMRLQALRLAPRAGA